MEPAAPAGTDGPAGAPAPASGAEALIIADLHLAPRGLFSLPDLLALRGTSTELLRAVGAAHLALARLDLGVVDDPATLAAASRLLRGLRSLVELRATADPERLAGLLASCASDTEAPHRSFRATGAPHGPCRVVSRMTCVATPAGLLRLEAAFAIAPEASAASGRLKPQLGGRRSWWGWVGGPLMGARGGPGGARARPDHRHLPRFKGAGVRLETAGWWSWGGGVVGWWEKWGTARRGDLRRGAVGRGGAREIAGVKCCSDALPPTLLPLPRVLEREPASGSNSERTLMDSDTADLLMLAEAATFPFTIP
jgi:hypothetical protein